MSSDEHVVDSLVYMQGDLPVCKWTCIGYLLKCTCGESALKCTWIGCKLKWTCKVMCIKMYM